jgi:DNA-binding MarR family transcriptional regulator
MQDNRLAEKTAREIEKLIRIHLANSYRDNLRPAQWQALRFFAGADVRERTLTGFARHRRSTMGTASMTVSQLVERGYLERGDPRAQRNVDIRISDKGRQALRNDPLTELEAAVGGLPEQDQTDLLETLRRITAELDPSGTAAEDTDGT